MPRWPILMLLAAIAWADAPEVESISFWAACGAASPPRYDPLVFWAPGGAERVLVRARLARQEARSSARVVVSVAWGLLPSGGPLTEEAIVWTSAEELRSFDVALSGDGRGELLVSIPIARRALAWRDSGRDVVRCRVLVDAGGGEPHRAELEVLPPVR